MRMCQSPIFHTARKEKGRPQEHGCSSAVWSDFLKSFLYRGMIFIRSTGNHSDIHRTIRNIFPPSGSSLYRKSKCLKVGKSVTALSALIVIMYVLSLEARKLSPWNLVQMYGWRLHICQQFKQKILYEIWEIHFLCTQEKGS